ncbi:MAG: DegT/DnrJ/EryC1/StrS family aminotransferase [candidate division Zixibacteria bacterium]|nr:DegT/DnrJ/EryC1/StrS family aminotransferase [candidate division Zixibacteria bacterium]
MEKSSTVKLIKPNISLPEIEAVTRVLQSGMLVCGPMVQRFEELLADYLGMAHAVCVSSGTAALHLALIAADIKPEDEVLVPAFTFPATANVVEVMGAVPIFIDCRPDGVNMDESKLVEKISARTKAIMPVHAFGIPVEMDTVLEIAQKYNLIVIEDAACALGSKSRNINCGTFGDLAAFSFHPRKLLTTGEGGAVVTNERISADTIKSLRNHGAENDDYSFTGLNYRMTDFQAAMGISQLERYQPYIDKRIELAESYRSLLKEIQWLEPIEAMPWTQWNVQTFVALVADGIDRNSLIKHMAARGVEATIGTYCVPLTRYFRLRYGYEREEFPHAYDFYKRCISLPLFNDMSTDDMHRVFDAMKSFDVQTKRVSV